jgi:carbon storage regulator
VLIITRRAGERIVIGDGTVVEVMEVSGNTVRIGVEAPREVPVYREEIWAAVKQENEASAKAEAERMPRPAPNAGARA